MPGSLTPATPNHKHQFANSWMLRDVAQLQNGRDYMEDKFGLFFEKDGEVWTQMFGVYDGHSAFPQNGDRCAQKLSDHFLPFLYSRISPCLQNIHKKFDEKSARALEASITHAFEAFDAREFLEELSGSTASVAIVTNAICNHREDPPAPFKNKNYQKGPNKSLLIVCNLGDSKFVVHDDDKIIFETVDHKPDTPSEKARIISLGGDVKDDMGTPRVCGVLATSRAFGDCQIKPQVTSKPRVTMIVVSKPLHAFLATDGVFEGLRAVQVAALLNKLSAKQILQLIKDKRLSADNLTLLCFAIRMGA